MKPDANSEGVSQSAYTQVLARKPFRTLWFGQICSQLAINTLLFVLGLRIYQSTGSNTAVSGLFLFFSIPSVLFGLVAGTSVDRLDKRKVLVLCDLIRAILVFGLMFTSHNVPVVYVLISLCALITQFYLPAEAPLIPQIVPKHLLVTANSLFTFTFYSSLAIGTVLAGPFLRWFGPQGVFLFIALLFLTASIFSFYVPSQSKGTIGLRHLLKFNISYLFSRMWTNLVEGIHYVRNAKHVASAIMLLTSTQIIFALLGTLGPGFADRVLNMDVRDASVLIVGPAVLGILLGVIWVGSQGYRYKSERLIQIGILAAGATLMTIAFSARLLRMPSFAWAYEYHLVFPFEFILFFLLGVANSLLDVPANATLQGSAHGSMRGRVYGILTAFVGGVGVIPVVAGGVLADTVGIGKVIFLLGAIIVAYGIYRLRYNRV
jgi:MFS transporter, DHA3 family, macrolide efflux protein